MNVSDLKLTTCGIFFTSMSWLIFLMVALHDYFYYCYEIKFNVRMKNATLIVD